MAETAPVPIPVPTPSPVSALELMRHAVATLAYRAAKVLRDVPEGFAEFRSGPSSRSAGEIVGHMGDLMAWGARLARGEYRWQAGDPLPWAEAVDRFFHELAALDAALADAALADSRLVPPPADVLFQGPIADALTHVGQLALMRGMAGEPVRPESFARASIQPGRVGRDQAPPGREFDGDASRPGPKS